MVIGQIWINANPALRDHLRQANEQRSAAFYAAWRAVTAPLRGLVEAVRRVRDEHETYRELNRLDDRQLKDIGISRSEIGDIVQAVAVERPEAGLTIAELRRTRSNLSAGRDAQVVALPRADQRRGRGGSRVAPQSTAAASAERDRLAS